MTAFDGLLDLEEPRAAAGRVLRALTADGTFLVVVPSTGQDAGRDEAALRRVLAEAGFTHFRRTAETPFNRVYEARP